MGKPKFLSHKIFGHDRGLSCCFRQHKATHSHCSLLHGYSIQVELEFMADTLDDRNWVMDFGDFGAVKTFLELHFDHKTLVAHDDPDMDMFRIMSARRMIDMVVLDRVGCEAFAEFIFQNVSDWTKKETNGRVELFKVTVKEHGANGASYVEL